MSRRGVESYATYRRFNGGVLYIGTCASDYPTHTSKHKVVSTVLGKLFLGKGEISTGAVVGFRPKTPARPEPWVLSR